VNRIFVDTGAWYALIDRRDPDHPAVKDILRHWQGRLVTSNFVVDETVTLLRYRLDFEPALLFAHEVRGGALAQVYRVSSGDEDAAWSLFERYRDKTFSFTDCTSFALMERLRLDTALALDGDFRSYGLHSLPEP